MRVARGQSPPRPGPIRRSRESAVAIGIRRLEPEQVVAGHLAHDAAKGIRVVADEPEQRTTRAAGEPRQAIRLHFAVRLHRGRDRGIRCVELRRLELQHVDGDAGRLRRRAERGQVDELRFGDETLGDEDQRLRTVDLGEPRDQAAERVDRQPRLGACLLRQRAALLLDLVGAGVAHASRFGDARRIFEPPERLPAFAQHDLIEPRPAAVADGERLGQPHRERHRRQRHFAGELHVARRSRDQW